MRKSDKAPEFIPLAVVGLGGVFPKAKTLRHFWANIKNKVDAIEDVPASHWSKEDYFDADPKRQDKVYAYKGGFLDAYDFDPSEFGMSPNTIEATDPAQLFALVAAKMALADAGYAVDQDTWDRARVSCILGVTGALEIVIPLGARLSLPAWRKAILAAGVAPSQAEDALARMSDEFVPWQESSFPGLLGNVVAGRVANRFNLGGTNCVVDAACGSSLSAMHMAALELQAGRAKMVLTGGVDAFNDIFMYTCFTKTPALSPSGHAKPFDAKADGTTLGEGVGMIVLKRLDDAQKDGDTIHAILRGLGTSSDGRGKSIYAPSAGGQTRAIEEAYRLSGLSPDTVELVEAHGTGTAVGDGIEVEALSGVYKKTGREGAWVALGSVKSMIGHTKAAAGSAAFIKAAMALRHKVLPPTLKVTEPLPILAQGGTPFYLSLEKRPWMASKDHPRRAACSALGFGGTNFHAILEEASAAKTETDWDGEHELFAVSGDCAAKLASLAAARSWDEVRAACQASRAAFDRSAQPRLVLALERGCDWNALAEKAKSLKPSPAEGIYFGTGAPGRLGVLFPGQGAQYVGMSRDLVCAFPESFDALSRADEAFEGGTLSSLMFPQPAWKQEQKDAQEKALRDTSVAQPALGAAALSAWSVLARFGLKADAAAGHSYGELVALHVAGRFDAKTLHVLSGLRGRLMKGDGADRGSMLAVAASLTEVAKAVEEEKLDLVIANRNAPAQNVLSGATSEIEKAGKILFARGFKCVRLPVAAAFHSPLVASALKPFGAALEKANFSKPTLPVYANTTGEAYPEDAKNARALLGGQLGKPVEFVKSIEAMRRDGITTFVECGAGNRLTGLVAQIAPDAKAFALDASNGKRNGIADLSKLLAQLAALGYDLDLKGWQGGEKGLFDGRPTPKLAVKLTGATYRSTPKKKFSAPTPPVSAATSHGAAPAGDAGLLGQALSAAQASIDALTKLQEQTAALHLQFLQGQDSAQRSVQALVEQQQALYAKISGHQASSASVSRPAPVAAPVIVAVTPKANVLPALISVVSAKTGYPADTIDPDMDLEADLGIDSIKRVEILSAVSEKLPGAPKVKPEHLGTLRNLKQIAAYLSEGMAVSAPVSAPAAVVNVAVNHASADNAPSIEILPILLSVVADKTGYPPETINPDMDLEADLGIDSIKRVEILSAVSEKLPGAPKVKPEHLGTLRNLKQIAVYLSEGMAVSIPVSAAVVDADVAVNHVPPHHASSIEILPVLLSVVADKTGYPADTINPDMDLEADLGIDSIKRVEILSAVSEKLPGAPKVKPEHLGTLRNLKQIAAYLSEGMAVSIPISAPAAVVDVAAENSEPCIITRLVPELVPAGPRDAYPFDKSLTVAVTKDSGLDAAVIRELEAKGFLTALIEVADAKSLPANLGALIVVAPARPASQGCPWTAESEAWLKKSFALVQAAGRSFEARGVRGLVMTVTRLDGALGFAGKDQDPSFGGLAGLMKTAAREWKSACRAVDVDPALTLAAAAKLLVKEMSFEGPVEAGLTAAGLSTVALVERPASAPTREPLEAGDAVIVTGGARGVTAACALALAKAFKPRLVLVGRSPLPGAEPAQYAACASEADLRTALARAGGLTLKEVGAKAKELSAAREIRRTLARLAAAGVTARYRAADARDAAAVRALVAETVKDFGPIRGLVHGAGVLADKAILDKTPAMVDSVLDTKLAGLRCLLDAVAPSELRVLALFSSSTARYGRVGQSDYALANEALNKAAQALARRLSECRVISFGWGPWDGGMVDAGLKKLFASEGVGVIGLEQGGEHLVAELRAAGPAETLVLAAPAASKAALPVSFERDLTLEAYPFLESHVLNGRAVLPLALSAEWLAHAALHAHPGLAFVGFDDLRVAKGITVRRGAATAIKAHAGSAEKRDGVFAVCAELRGEGGALHVRATVLLAVRRPAAPAAILQVSGPAYGRAVDKAYREVLFHGPDMQFILSVPHCGPEGIVVESKTAPPPVSWARLPIRDRWLADPAALDAAFQAMILWTDSQMGEPSLPSFVAKYRQYAERFPERGVRVTAKAARRAEGLAGADIEFTDERGALVARLEGFECAADASLAGAFRRNAVEAASL